MSKKIVWIISCLILIGANRLLYADPPASYSPQKKAERQTTLNKMTDYWATIGKSDWEKKEILRERKKDRADTRLREAKWQKNKNIQQRMKAQEKAIMEKENL